MGSAHTTVEKQPSSKSQLISFLPPTSVFLSVLLLLDLSATLDTVDHTILLSRLQSGGITGTALQWFISYLSDRNHLVLTNNSKSHTSPVNPGVPQGSVLGPLLCIIYMLPLVHQDSPRFAKIDFILAVMLMTLSCASPPYL